MWHFQLGNGIIPHINGQVSIFHRLFTTIDIQDEYRLIQQDMEKDMDCIDRILPESGRTDCQASGPPAFKVFQLSWYYFTAICVVVDSNFKWDKDVFEWPLLSLNLRFLVFYFTLNACC